MRKDKLLFLSFRQLIFLIYFIITTAIFYISISQGNDGVSLKLFGGGDDGYFYWTQAKNVAMGKEWIRTSIYPLIIGYLIKIIGIKSVYIIRIFNYFGFILLVFVSMKLIDIQFIYLKENFNFKHIYRSKILLLLGFLFYASLQMNVNLSIYRDIWIYTLYTLSVLLSVKLIFYSKNIIYFILLILSLWLLGEFRRYALLSFILGLSFYIMYKKFLNKKLMKIHLMIIIILLGIYYTLFINFKVPIVNMSLRDVLIYRKYFIYISPGGSQMWIDLEQSNFILFIINYIHSYIGNLLGPLPWHIKGFSLIFAFFAESIPMLFIMYYLFKKRHLLSELQGYVLLQAFIWIGLISISNDNVGTATRLRVVTWILILIVFVVVNSKGKNNKTISNNIQSKNFTIY